MYKVVYSSNFKKAHEKLHKKNFILAQSIHKKIEEIAEYPEHFKPLKNDLKGYRRVHFGSYVLLYRFKDGVVELMDIDHHDFAYKR